MSDTHGPERQSSASGSAFFGAWFLAAALAVGAVYLIYALTWLYG